MSKEPYPSETADRFIVRFPDGMRDRIRDEAAKNNRSMNAEIIHRLQETLEMDDYQPMENVNTDNLPAGQVSDGQKLNEMAGYLAEYRRRFSELLQLVEQQNEQIDRLIQIKTPPDIPIDSPED